MALGRPLSGRPEADDTAWVAKIDPRGTRASWQLWLGRVLDFCLTDKRFRYLTIGVVATAGLALRLVAIDELGVNSDEAVYSGQAASLAGIESFLDDFSPFRAHPLLFQFTLSLVYRIAGFTDTGGRLVAAGFGILTVFATYAVGKRAFSKRIGLIAALAVVVTPYHVVVSRQALLEGAMTFFFTMTMYALIRYRDDRTPSRAVFIGVAAGLTFMSKEVGVLVLLVVAVVVLVEGGYPLKHLLIGMGAFIISVSPHLVASRLGGVESEAGGAGWIQYLIWQLGRPPNHPGSFYLSNIVHYFGLPLALLALVGGVMLARSARRNAHHNLLLAWILVPVLFFQVWKVKGYHYLVEIVPAVAIVASVALDWLAGRRWTGFRRSAVVLAGLALLSMTWITAVNGPVAQNYARIGDAGYAGIPGGKEAAVWIRDNTPEGARFLAIGPSIGNIVVFYADVDIDALSISPNPVRTNPAYEAVRNPDYQLRWGLYEYIIYDQYSAERTAHFANRLLDFIGRYGGELVYEGRSTRIGDDGVPFSAPVIKIFRVKPVGTGAGA